MSPGTAATTSVSEGVAPIRLPLGRPAIASYLFLAYPLAILAAHGETVNWLLEHFIQFYHAPGRGLKVHTHTDCTAARLDRVYDAGFPGLQQRCLDPGTLTADPLEFLRYCLQTGIYPQIDVDMTLLGLGAPTDPWLHEVLVCGMAGSRFEFFAFDAHGRLCRQWVNAQDLALALRVDGRRLLTAARARGEELPDWLITDWGGRPRWILHQYACAQDTAADRLGERQPRRPEALNTGWPDPDGPATSQIVKQLDRYVRSLPPAEARIDRLPADTTWGCAAQTALGSTLRETGRIPTICLRLWWEHKRIMARRLQWLAGHGLVEGWMVQRSTEWVQEAGRLRLAALRLAALGPQRQPHASKSCNRIAEGIAAMAREECTVLQQIVRGQG